MPRDAPRGRTKDQPLAKKLILLLGASILGAALVLTLWLVNPDPQHWVELGKQCIRFLEAHPGPFYSPSPRSPASAFRSAHYLFSRDHAGAAIRHARHLRSRYWRPSTCTLWTYLLASGPLRITLEQLLKHRRALPKLDEANAFRLALIMRITPGIPYALQNVVLGVAGMRLKTLPPRLTPDQRTLDHRIHHHRRRDFDGRAGLAITGGLILVVLILLTRMLRNKAQPLAHG